MTPIESLGQPFDPAVHEAVETDPAGGRHGRRGLPAGLPARRRLSGRRWSRSGPESKPASQVPKTRKQDGSQGQAASPTTRDSLDSANRGGEQNMARTIGIDLGTTNSVMATIEGGEPVGDPERRGRAADPVGRRRHRQRRAAGRPLRPAAGGHQPGEHRLLGQALHGPQVQRPGRAARQGAGAVQDPGGARTATSRSRWATAGTARRRSRR